MYIYNKYFEDVLVQKRDVQRQAKGAGTRAWKNVPDRSVHSHVKIADMSQYMNLCNNPFYFIMGIGEYIL